MIAIFPEVQVYYMKCITKYEDIFNFGYEEVMLMTVIDFISSGNYKWIMFLMSMVLILLLEWKLVFLKENIENSISIISKSILSRKSTSNMSEPANT